MPCKHRIFSYIFLWCLFYVCWYISIAAAFLSLLRDLGSAYVASHTFDVKKAVEIFESLPYHHYKTGWTLSEVGKAYLELSEYQKVYLLYFYIIFV